MKKILIINTIGFDLEGISSVILNYLEHMDRSNVNFDFIVQPSIRDDVKKRLGYMGDMHEIPMRKEDLRGYVRGLRGVLKKNRYDAIHIHGNSGTMAIETLLAAAAGVKKRIVHCHNTSSNHPLINKILTPMMKITATDYLACSRDAGRFLYGKSRFTVLNNAIDINRFRFDSAVRRECRKEFGIDKEFVIGHVGNFVEQKNHTFLIEVFKKFYKTNSDSRLLLVSDGPLMEEIQRKVVQYGLEDAVIFAGRRKDVERLYCAMDVFVFPSLWEGLPVVMLEAQAAGLPILASGNITQEAKYTERVIYKKISDGSTSWAKKIAVMSSTSRFRSDEYCSSTWHKFDIKQEAKKLREIYEL